MCPHHFLKLNFVGGPFHHIGENKSKEEFTMKHLASNTLSNIHT